MFKLIGKKIMKFYANKICLSGLMCHIGLCTEEYGCEYSVDLDQLASEKDDQKLIRIYTGFPSACKVLLITGILHVNKIKKFWRSVVDTNIHQLLFNRPRIEKEKKMKKSLYTPITWAAGRT